jgi:drug/metabolite transporter (DMT)-like permease
MVTAAPTRPEPASPIPAPLHRPLLGILFMCLASAFFPAMNGLAKLMTQTYSSEQVVWARTLSHLIFVFALFVPQHGLRILHTRRPGIQFIRSCLLMLATLLFFSALRFVSMAEAASISFTAPLIVAILAGPMLGEKVTLSRVAALLVGFAGVLVVIRPGTDVFQWASLLIVGNACCYALYQILTRRVSVSDSPETSAVYSALVGSVLMSLIVPFFWTTPGSWTDVALLASLGVFGGFGHYCVARALFFAPANLVSPFQYLQMIGSVAVGYLLFSDMPDALTWAGAALIIGAGLWVGSRAQAGQTR